MTQSPTATRPPHVTFAGWVAVMGSLFLVMNLWAQVGQLRTERHRDYVSGLLRTSPFDRLDVGVDRMLDLMHVSYVTVGALAAAAGILGWFVLRRDRGARIGLSLVAVPLALSVPFGGGLLAVMIVVSAAVLWSGPARDWFAGRPVRQPATVLPPPPPAVPRMQAPAAPAPVLPPVGPGVASDAPPPYAGYGAPRPASAYAPVTARPPALIAAVMVTWVGVATALLVLGIMVVEVLTNDAFVADAISQTNDWFPQASDAQLTPSDVRVSVVVLCSLLAAWALAAAVLALLVLLRVGWARPLLVISAIVSALVSWVAIAAVITVVPAVGGMVATYLLLRPDVTRWLNRQ